jgi:hypothetical protein
MKILLTRHQHGVGQGGFHSSGIYALTNERSIVFQKRFPFELVFDCGTSCTGPRGLKKKDFLKQHIQGHEPDGCTVDAFFISHLDRDHYEGAEQLCKSKTVLRIFLPYFSVEEIILLILDQIVNDIGISTAFINAMLGIARGTKTLFNVPVTIVGGSSTQDSNTQFPPSTVQADRLIAETLQDDGKAIPIGSVIPSGASIVLRAQEHRLPWRLRPWSYKQSAAAQSAMEALVSSIPELDNVRTARLPISATDLEAIENRKHDIRQECKKVIENAKGVGAGDFNSPSLCLYSGPVSHMSPTYRISYVDRGNSADFLAANPSGWLTTGDSVLRTQWPEFRSCYEDVLGLIGTFVVPHHGAVKNHSPSFADIMGSRLAVVCARQYSEHHPHADVLNALYGVNAAIKIVTEYDAIGLREVIHVELPYAA